MKIQPARAERFVSDPDPAIRAVLVYGPDRGLVQERALALVRAAAEDPNDPFRSVVITPEALKATPSLIADEAAALSLTGGRRAVRIAPAGDDHAGALKDVLEHPMGDALVIAEAGELPPRSALRALFEGASNAVAVPCYRDDAQALGDVIDEVLSADGLAISRDARAHLASVLGDDRAMTRRTLEKLALYAGPGSGRTVELDDVLACVGDTAALGLDDVVMAAGDGDLTALDRALGRLPAAGTTPVSVLNAAARHFQRLHLTQGLVRSGMSPDQAMGRLRPPVFWKTKPRFAAQVESWPEPALSNALQRFTAAMMQCMRTGAPAEAIAARALFAAASLKPSRPGGRPRRPRGPAG
jgi:DNA polymerase-3 subunit delta